MRPWVRGELSWLTSGPIHRVHDDAWSEVQTFLERWSYRVVELDGRQMTSLAAAHAELNRAFGLPGPGHNWDAFRDDIGDYLEAHDEARTAVVWRDLETAAKAAPVTVVETGWALLAADLEVFALGRGDDFDRPT